MERDSVLAAEKLLEKEMPYNDAEAHLLIQLDGNNQDAVDADFETVGDICLDHGARDVLVARDRHTRDRLWEARRMIIESLKHESPVNHMEDVVVPRAEIPALLAGVKALAAEHGVRIICFGHAGDGNVHVNVLADGMATAEWEALVPVLSQAIYELAIPLGGTITGEHGIGVTRRKYLHMALEEAQIELMRRVKAAFDPNQILNPGKILPEPAS
jgi:glycolate oxidase